MLLRNLGLALVITTASSALLAPCEPEPPVDAHWSEGGYDLITPYVFRFRQEPYVLEMEARTQSDVGTGDFEGELEWIFWLSDDNFESGAPADCVFLERLSGEASAEGAVEGVDYGTCIDCDPYSAVIASDIEVMGPNCTDDLIEYWATDDETGDLSEGFETVFGYRHADSNGWPADWESIVGMLEDDLGATGSIYDTLLDGQSLQALWIVIPTLPLAPGDDPKRQSAQLPREHHIPVTVDGLGDLR